MVRAGVELARDVAGGLRNSRAGRLAEGAAMLAVGGYFASHYVPPAVRFIRDKMTSTQDVSPAETTEKEMYEQIDR